MSFSDLTLRVLDEPGWFESVNPCRWWGDFNGQQVVIDIPEGTKTDLASIPWGLRNVLSQVGRSRKPAYFHDYNYSRKWRTRKECDQLFRQMLIERGMSKFKAYVYYMGVRAGGWTRGNW
jgi:hypothetical protein